MNIVSIDSPDTLPIIYERGLFGVYHDWCESFSTYPRTYDLLHADHLFSKTKKKYEILYFSDISHIINSSLFINIFMPMQVQIISSDRGGGPVTETRGEADSER